MTPLTADQIKARAALLGTFRTAIQAALWEAIETCDQSLLCSDDGWPYGDLRLESLGVTSLEMMVNESSNRAVAHMERWL